MGIARQFLAISGVAILAYLLLAHATGAEGIINGLGTAVPNVYKTLQGR